MTMRRNLGGRILLVALVAASIAMPPLAPAARAAVAVGDRVTIPPSGSVTIAGRGYGHGIGLSQWGSRAAAAQGVGYRQILDFYYPGTTHATQAAADIRVLISADTDNVLQVVAEEGMTATDTVNTRRPIGFRGETVTQWRVVRAAAGLYLEGLVDGAWRRWSQGASASYLGIDAPDGTIRVILPNGSSKVYRGSMRAVEDGAAPRLRSVNVVPMEVYLRSVVPSESPSGWPPDALRAQAVAARTYASFERREAGSRAWHTCDTTACQVYPGYQTYSASGTLTATHEAASTNAAVEATANQVRHYDGAPAFTQFSASNGGWTKAGSRPYLVSRQDPWDAVGNPAHSWQTKVSERQLSAAYPQVGTVRSIDVRTRSGNGEWGGRVEQVIVIGTRGQTTTTGPGFRSALGLRSDWWKVTGSTRVDTDFSSDGRPDVVAQTSDGGLRLYEGTGAGRFAGSTSIGHGWGGMRLALRANDLTGNGRADVLAVDSGGTLWRYPANGAGRFEARTRVGGGWSSTMRIVAPGDIDGDGNADMLAIDRDGVMWRYSGTGTGSFGTKVRVGPGWGSMSNVVGGGDWDGDGHVDFLATDPSGLLYLYRGNGNGYFPRSQIGHGWTGMRLISVSSDWDGDGWPDLLAADRNGALFQYRWDGTRFTGRTQIGSGWNNISRLL